MSRPTSHSLLAIRDTAVRLRDKLVEAKTTELPTFRPYLDEQIKYIEEALTLAKVPDFYRVAIVGRFKVGKSSFVNTLTDAKLAGVETSPETAAISLFRYAATTYAEVTFVSQEDWAGLKADYEADPNDPDVKRYAGFRKFNRPLKRDKDSETNDTGTAKNISGPKAKDIGSAKTKGTDKAKANDGSKAKARDAGTAKAKDTGKTVEGHPSASLPVVDLAALEEKWLRPGGHTHRIEAADWTTKEGKATFRRELKQFTSSQEPLHYLVDRLTIHSPIALLGDNIELIDTPGLDDTERFRVRLTEDLVKEVDAILFLTQSGASYSQSDKDFIVRQLRQRQIKHLQIIATKIDDTYKARVHDARENDEEPPSFASFCVSEKNRIRLEVKKTLDELLATNQLSDEDGYYFVRQLDTVPIHLISTHYYSDKELDKSGIPAVREKLYEVLSASQRFEDARTILTARLAIVVQRLKGTLTGRLNAIERDYDPEKVRTEIAKIRLELKKKLRAFGERAGKLVTAMTAEQAALGAILPTHLDSVCLLAENVFHEFEKQDVGRAWQSKRYKHWGDLNDLQSRVADLIFPKIELLLNQYIQHFGRFSKAVATQLQHLESDVKSVEESNSLSGLDPLSLEQAHQNVLGEFEKLLAEHAPRERDSILKQLEDFTSQEVQTRIDIAKATVADEWGKGTAGRQNTGVEAFYRTLRQLLSAALREHLEKHFASFAGGLRDQATAVRPQIEGELLSRLDERVEAIESTLSLATNEEKGRVLNYLSGMIESLPDVAAVASRTQQRSDLSSRSGTSSP